MKISTLIVGAGITGLMIAQKLSSSRAVVVFDKARGVGGRIATRRTERAKFDHGAQFYRPKDPISELHRVWSDRSLVNHWFDDKGERHFNAIGGMTGIAKDLAQNLNVILNERVRTLKSENTKWSVTFESGRIELADEVIFSSPVPQSLEILRASGIAYTNKLNDVVYTKALVVLVEDSRTSFKFESHGYSEPVDGFFFSIADQYEKRVSPINSITATLNAEVSESLFDTPDEEVIRLALAELKKLSHGFESGPAQLKKWRYCKVKKTFGELFTEIAQGLYLAGDGFGGASLNGAARSATALANHLTAE